LLSANENVSHVEMVPAKRQNIAHRAADDSILAAQLKNTQNIIFVIICTTHNITLQ